MRALPVAFKKPPLVNQVQMLVAPTGPGEPPSAQLPNPALPPRPVQPAFFSERPALAEPLRRRMATYEVEAACTYAAVPDLARMHQRLASACEDFRQLEEPEHQMEAARLRVIEALSARAEAAAEQGDADQAQQLVDAMAALSKACPSSPLEPSAAAVLLAKAHLCAFEQAAEAARYSAEFGDATQLAMKLAEAASHPGDWSFTDEDRALLFAVCVRRLTDPSTSLLAQMPVKPFVESQMAAVRALAEELKQPIPASLEAIASLLAQTPTSSMDEDFGLDDDDDREDGGEDEHAIPAGAPRLGLNDLPSLPELVAQSERQARLNP